MKSKAKLVLLLFVFFIFTFICIVVSIATPKVNEHPGYSDWYGTYKLKESIQDDELYLTIFPANAKEQDVYVGDYQWYSTGDGVLEKNEYELTQNPYIQLKHGNKNAIIFYGNENYYFVDDGLKPLEIVKISSEPIVAEMTEED